MINNSPINIKDFVLLLCVCAVFKIQNLEPKNSLENIQINPKQSVYIKSNWQKNDVIVSYTA